MRLSAMLVTFMVILSLDFFATADEVSVPVIELPPGNMTALVGEEVILECIAAGNPAPTLTWLYQGQPLVNDTGRLQILETGGLLINDVKESDTGKYSCQAASDAGQAIATADLVVVGKTQAPEIQFSEGIIRDGVGYSTDKQQIVAQACYNAESTHSSQQQATIKLESAMSFGELENEIGVSVSVKGSYWMFSADASANYMRSMKDKDYSTSLNYYAKYTTQTTVQLAGGGEDALTAVGKSFYKNNKYFGLVCGDEYVVSYEQGVFLAMGINIMFSSSESKQKFDAKVGASFGDIISASTNISGFINENKIYGTVSIQALQIGGEPSQLSKMLSHDDSKYYALMCSLTEMENCIKASSGLLDYARNELPKQFSFKNNTGLTPIGLGTTRYNPADEIGLDMPSSVVTTEIEQIRKELSDKLQENEYYKQKLHPFVVSNGYPLLLDEGFLSKAHDLFHRVDMNIDALMQPHGGAADCFNKPLQCETLKPLIDSRLTPVTQEDLSFLDDIKYSGTFNASAIPFFPDGRKVPWYESMFDQMKVDEKEMKIHEIKDSSEENNKLKFTMIDKQFFMTIFELKATQTHGSEVTYEGDGIMYFMGNPMGFYPLKVTKKISPFYFEAYKSSL